MRLNEALLSREGEADFGAKSQFRLGGSLALPTQLILIKAIGS